MRNMIFASSLVSVLMMNGCGDRATPPAQSKIAVKAATINSQTNTIVTDDDYSKVTLFGELGSKVFINGEEVGTFPETGSLEVTFEIKDVGTHSYRVYAQDGNGIDTQTILITIQKNEKSASLGSVSTAGEAGALTVSQEGIIFIAEKDHGVEIISVGGIGFNDRVSSELLSSIDSIDAQNVILSEDEKTLYIEDKEGKFHLVDISDISHPTEVEVVDEIEKSVSVISVDGTSRYRVADCGLVAQEVSNPSDIRELFILRDTKIQDVILVEDDTKLLLAHGTEGLQLMDLSDPMNPAMIGTKSLGGDTSGLSLLKKDGILFVANGASGVEIFDLDILLHEMTR